ncbi:MAG: hypothetical protein WAO98_00420 [Alphaproteobacteria bacterium]
MKLRILAASFIFILALMPLSSHAAEKITAGSACTGDASALDWDTVWNCVSSVWTRAALIIGISTDTCDSNHAGEISYTSTTPRSLQYCNGTAWTNIVIKHATPAAADIPAGAAWFVLTQTAWTGNLGGQAGADAKCLTELSGNSNWLGYSNALSRLDAAHVKSFSFCSPCLSLQASTPYYFARVGDATIGGASFTVDSSNLGPNDNANWAAANYFGGSFTYWSSRYVAGSGSSTTQWINTVRSSGENCSTYGSASAGTGGFTGQASNTNRSRWYAGGNTCEKSFPQICVVNP